MNDLNDFLQLAKEIYGSDEILNTSSSTCNVNVGRKRVKCIIGELKQQEQEMYSIETYYQKIPDSYFTIRSYKWMNRFLENEMEQLSSILGTDITIHLNNLLNEICFGKDSDECVCQYGQLIAKFLECKNLKDHNLQDKFRLQTHSYIVGKAIYPFIIQSCKVMSWCNINEQLEMVDNSNHISKRIGLIVRQYSTLFDMKTLILTLCNELFKVLNMEQEVNVQCLFYLAQLIETVCDVFMRNKTCMEDIVKQLKAICKNAGILPQYSIVIDYLNQILSRMYKNEI